MEHNGHSIDLLQYREAIVRWGDEHFRDFPWRCTSNPYRFLLAELLLIRTAAGRVEEVYSVLVDRYPTPEDLSEAATAELEDLIEPLGLAKRAAYLKEMADELVHRFAGEVPETYEQLKSLSGVGKYVAAAVCCFVYDQNVPLVDANTLRVVRRNFGVDPSKRTYRNSEMRELIGRMAAEDEPARYYYAMLDLAAEVCHAVRNPECSACPVLDWCQEGQAQIGR